MTLIFQHDLIEPLAMRIHEFWNGFPKNRRLDAAYELGMIFCQGLFQPLPRNKIQGIYYFGFISHWKFPFKINTIKI